MANVFRDFRVSPRGNSRQTGIFATPSAPSLSVRPAVETAWRRPLIQFGRRAHQKENRVTRTNLLFRRNEVLGCVLMDEYDAVFRAGARVIVQLSTGLHDIRSRRQRSDVVIAEDVGPGSLEVDAVIGPGVAVRPGCESRRQL